MAKIHQRRACYPAKRVPPVAIVIGEALGKQENALPCGSTPSPCAILVRQIEGLRRQKDAADCTAAQAVAAPHLANAMGNTVTASGPRRRCRAAEIQRVAQNAP